jgi:hypothetical protein
MASLFSAAGLGNVHSERHDIVVRRPHALDNSLGLRDWAALAADQGLVSRAEAQAWEDALDQAATRDAYCYAFQIVITSGTKPCAR